MKVHKQINLLSFTKNNSESGINYLTHYFFFILLLIFSSVNAQKENNIWCFGDSAGIDFNDPTNPVTFTTSLDTRGSCVSIADSMGQLLFYANTRATLPGNTTRIWNKYNQLMDNGDSIVGSGWYNELIIIPFPGSDSLYYIFSVGVTSVYGFYYSIVDMTENAGSGKVIAKNIQLNTYKAWDGMAAVKHANGRDWWLITKDDSIGSGTGNNTFHKYLITTDTILEQVQSIGNSVQGSAGNMVFSVDGSKFLFSTWIGLVEVINFDRCTGQFSNPVIVSGTGNSLFTFGAAFSPNGNVVYVSRTDTTSYLFQYDLTAPNIPASKDTLCVISFPTNAAGLIRLAPDNKIYLSCVWYNGVNFNYPYQDTMYHTENMNLSVISDPDVVGSGCNFSLYSFPLGGKRTYWGLPNNPDYDLGSVSGSICDTLTSVEVVSAGPSASLSVYYHSDWQTAFVNASGLKGKNLKLILSDISGRILFTEDTESRTGYFTKDLSMSEYASGVYLVTIFTEREKLTKKVVVE